MVHLVPLYLCLSVVSAHMYMSYPPPLRGANNPHAGSNVDSNINAPLSGSGADFPCKNTLSLLGTPAGAPVASWAAGGAYNMTIAGGAAHGGGSCQASLSLDGGKTFRVLHSFEGGCPGTSGTPSSFGFTVPADVPAAETAVFAWTWFNFMGNREMYMNCAVVSIEKGSQAGSSSFASRPAMFVANVGNGCSTVESANLKFPNPGPDVTVVGSNMAGPKGSCGSVSAAPSTASSSSSASTASSPRSSLHASSAGFNSGSGSKPPATFVTAPTTVSTHVPGHTPASSSSSSLDSSAGSSSNASGKYPYTGGSAGGWTPGNDFPVWYSDAAGAHVSLIVPLCVGLLALVFVV